jgi:hypothetical protein
MFSGVGGQMDFIKGAAMSEGGKPILALPSVTSKGVSRIVNFIKARRGGGGGGGGDADKGWMCRREPAL